MFRFFYLLLLLVTGAFSTSLVAQNLEAIGDTQPLNVSGGISLNQIGYAVKGIDARRDPYNYFISGAINLDLYGMSIPLSFMLSNQNNTFQQPFNQFGLTPVYKAFTGHLGYASMNFSPYTLNGHIFLGAGVDYKPQDSKFSVSAMYGRLQKAVDPDSSKADNLPYFQRIGFGLKVGYDNQGDFVHVIAFHAKDDPNSIAYVPEEMGILPQENLVLSIQAGKRMGPLSITGEVAGSAMNRDVRIEESDLETKNLFSFTGPLFRHNNASEYYSAYRTNIDYDTELFTVGLGYERIAPGYRTLGAYYFNNDLENITLNGNSRMLQGKLNISASAGTQRNNLDQKELNNMSRFIGSVNVNYTPGQKLNLNATYSNFLTYTVIRSAFETINQITPVNELDTLNFTQLSQSANLSASYALGNNPQRYKMLMLNLSYQQATDKQGGEIQDTGSRFINGNAAYTHQITPLQLGLTVAVNTNVSTAGDLSSTTLGPTVAVTKSMLDRKMQTNLSVSYNTQMINEIRNNTVSNVRLTASYRIQKRHSFSLSGIMLNKKSEITTAPSFTEYTITLGYNYNF